MIWKYDLVATVIRRLSHSFDPKKLKDVSYEQIAASQDKDILSIGPYQDIGPSLPSDFPMTHFGVILTERNYEFHPKNDEIKLYDVHSSWIYKQKGLIESDSEEKAKDSNEEKIFNLLPNNENWSISNISYIQFEQCQIGDPLLQDKFKILVSINGDWKLMEYYETYKQASLACKYYIVCKKFEKDKVAIKFIPPNI